VQTLLAAQVVTRNDGGATARRTAEPTYAPAVDGARPGNGMPIVAPRK
jgi:hypothetical protein